MTSVYSASVFPLQVGLEPVYTENFDNLTKPKTDTSLAEKGSEGETAPSTTTDA